MLLSRWQLIRSVMLSVVLLNSLAVAGLALEHYPTTRELQQLTQQFKQTLGKRRQNGTELYRDRRTALEKTQVRNFVQAWAKVAPEMTPFLGEWVALEETIAIYPSQITGKVCIIETFIPTENEPGVAITFGQIKDGVVLTESRLVLLQQDGFLGSTAVSQTKPQIYEYANPRPLKHPEQQKYLQETAPQVIAQFKQAGCTAELPERGRFKEQ